MSGIKPPKTRSEHDWFDPFHSLFVGETLTERSGKATHDRLAIFVALIVDVEKEGGG